MSTTDQHIVRLYLPLLCNPQPEVSQQAATLFLSSYGEQGLAVLRRLLAEADAPLRQQAAQGLRLLVGQGGAAPARPARVMHVECLGGLRVAIGEHTLQVHDWMQREGGRAGWRKVQGVFAYLVDRERRGASRADLISAIWGGTASATSLSRTLTALRQTLLNASDAAFVERVLVATRDHVVLAPELYQTDAQLFEHTFQVAYHTESERDLAAAAPLYAQALRIYRGPYLADLAGDWVQRRRDHYMNNYIIAAERLAEHYFGQRRYQQCIAICRRALEADEAAEEISVWLLRAYAQLQLYSDLAHEYRRYLRAATIAPHDGEFQGDPVVRTYQALVGARN